MPEKTLVLNSCIFLVKHIVAKTIEQLQQHLKKSYGTINSGFPEPSPACVPSYDMIYDIYDIWYIYDSRSTLRLRKPISRWGGSRVPAKNQDLDSSTGEGGGQWATFLDC